jgi:hypothetical protein
VADLNYTPHFLLRLGGQYGPEAWSIGLRMEVGGINFDNPLVPGNRGGAETISQAMTEVVETHARTFFTAVRNLMDPGVNWQTISCNRIARSGKYALPVSFERTVTPVAGTGNGNWGGPDVAVAATHLTDVTRGWASKGRVYLPLNRISFTGTVGPTYGNIQSSEQAIIGTAWAAFLGELNDLAVDLNTNIAGYNGYVVTGTRVGVFSPGTGKEQPRDIPGVWREVTGVRIGSQPDTQRRRVNKVKDLWGTNSVTYAVAG